MENFIFLQCELPSTEVQRDLKLMRETIFLEVWKYY